MLYQMKYQNILLLVQLSAIVLVFKILGEKIITSGAQVLQHKLAMLHSNYLFWKKNTVERLIKI